MTFTEMVERVAKRLNLTSDEAMQRIGEEVNDEYGVLISTLGMAALIRTSETEQTVIGDRFITFELDKITAVYNPARPLPPLGQITVDEMRNRRVRSDPPREYAIYRMGALTTTLLLDCTPATAYDLTADGYSNKVAMAEDDEPDFSEKFHPLLVYAVMEIELNKMEKPDMAKIMGAKKQQLISDLRFYIAKSAYLKFHQNK